MTLTPLSEVVMITGYVLKRRNDGKYVVHPHKNPSGNSYSDKLEYAIVFGSEQTAKQQACGNEYVVSLSKIFTSVVD